ncbi:hypothetical protein IU431_32745 [Nocardia otitidiscaviarum]|uniref:DUF6236 family protein n=1 Tax=Nocardia otitidiscaviarum TaxID=1823 RepID=UPI0004A77B60|nr:DUF6236 family protein [Nocardia otitidiscaviarum]MBF6488889.1 hypothetical protein [Nocardia otitidiscaviarum]
MSQITLYYPWMRFRNENWLKLALLTWDHLARIRPRAATDTDSDTVARLRAETDFLHDVEPVREDLRRLTNIFGDIITSGEPRVWQRYSWRAVVDSAGAAAMPRKSGGPRRAYPGLAWVHVGTDGPKAHLALSRLLEEEGLAVTVEESTGPYLGMHPRLADLYLTALADVVAARQRVSPVTDDPRAHAAVGTIDRLYALLIDDDVAEPVSEDARHAYLHFAAYAALRPERLRDVPLPTLLSFRERYAGQLRAFREHIGSLSKELESVALAEGPESARRRLRDVYRSTTKPRLEELCRASDDFGIDAAPGLLGIKVDLPAASTGATLPALSDLAGSGTGFAFAVVPYVADRMRARRTTIQETPVSYLLTADRKLTGKALLAGMRR